MQSTQKRKVYVEREVPVIFQKSEGGFESNGFVDMGTFCVELWRVRQTTRKESIKSQPRTKLGCITLTQEVLELALATIKGNPQL